MGKVERRVANLRVAGEYQEQAVRATVNAQLTKTISVRRDERSETMMNGLGVGAA
jgi:hypothetical protein